MGKRRTPLLMLNEPGQISSGLQPDRHSIGQLLWASAQNVRFYQGKVRRLIPPLELYVPLAAAKMRGLHQQQLAAGTRWVMSGHFDTDTTAVVAHRWNAGASALVVSKNAGSAVLNQTATARPTILDFTTWGDWTIINSGIGAATLFKPGVSTADLPNAPTGVVQFLKRQNQLVAVGHGANNRDVSFSDADDIETWLSDPDNLAWTGTIEELDTPIRAACKLGNNIACFAEDQLAMVYWVGLPYLFGQKVALDGIGAVGKLAVCVDGPLAYGLSRNGAWVTDGTGYDYIDQGIISDYLQDTVNWDQAAKAVVARNDVTRCIEFHFPSGAATENSEAWAFDPKTKGWGPITAYQNVMERRVMDKPIAAADGSVVLLDSDAAVPAAITLATKPLLMQTPQGAPLHEGSFVDEVELLAKTASNVLFRYGVSENLDTLFTYSEWLEIDTDMTTYQFVADGGGRMPSGTFHKIEFQSSASNWALDLQGIIFYGLPEGTKRPGL